FLAEHHAVDFGFDDAERSAIFDGRFGFRVPRFLVRETTGEDDLNHALRRAVDFFRGRVERAHFTGSEEVGESKSEAAEQSNLNEAAAAECGNVARTGAVRARFVHSGFPPQSSSSCGRLYDSSLGPLVDMK